MELMDTMNYRYNNPTAAIDVDKLIAKAFYSKERSEKQKEDFELWGSMSKERVAIAEFSNNYSMETTKQNVR